MISRTQDDRGQLHLQPVQSIESLIELSYYSNMLTPYFALQSVLMITFHELLPKPVDRKPLEAVMPSIVIHLCVVIGHFYFHTLGYRRSQTTGSFEEKPY